MTVLVHNRPHDNDCYDDFARRYGLETVHWSQYDGRPGGVCCLQDPVGPRKERAVIGCLNAGLNMARRDRAYPVWQGVGLRCPQILAYGWDIDWDGRPVLVKDYTRQMGKGYLITSGSRYDWLVTECSAFARYPERFCSVPFVELRNPGGYFELHRYVVCGDRAIPGVYAKTNGWSCKASHMSRLVKTWSQHERKQYADELDAFWRSTPPREVALAVSSLGLDFALVDCTLVDGRPFFWEVNPYMNLRPAEVFGKQTSWWPFFMNYLDGGDREVTYPDAWEQVELLLNWRGYKPCWISSR